MLFRIILFSLDGGLNIFNFLIKAFKKFDLFKLSSLLFWGLVVGSIFIYFLISFYRLFLEIKFFYFGYKKMQLYKIKKYIEIYELADPKNVKHYKLKKRITDKMKVLTIEKYEK